MKKPDANKDQSASKLITKKITGLEGWRGKTLRRMRKTHQGSGP